MRTYSHALLTLAAARYLKQKDGPSATWAAVGATMPDLPAGIGAAWLLDRGRHSREDFLQEVCGRSVFRRLDAALHSVLFVTTALLLYATLEAVEHDRGKTSLAFLLGWAGHVATDTLTHGSDARPLLWPLSKWRFYSPVSYRERERYGRMFTVVEHAVLLMLAAWVLRSGPRG